MSGSVLQMVSNDLTDSSDLNFVFASPVTVGSLIAVVMVSSDSVTSGLATPSGGWSQVVEVAAGQHPTDANPDRLALYIRTATTNAQTYAKPADGIAAIMYAYELAGVTASSPTLISLAHQAGDTSTSTPRDLGSLTPAAGSVAIMGFIMSVSDGFDPTLTQTGWTEDLDDGFGGYDGSPFVGTFQHPWMWAGHALGSGAPLEPALTNTHFAYDSDFEWAGFAVVFSRAVPPPKSGVVVDFGADGFDIGDHDWISDAQNVISWTITRGAGAEITTSTNPGHLTLVTKNPSDIYNPRNASGPLYGLLRDGLPIWVGPNSDGVVTGTDPRGIFAGRVTDITLLPAGGAAESPTVEWMAVDALDWYQRTPVQLDYAEGRSHAALRLAALIEAGETRYDLAHEIQTMPLSHADGNLGSVLDAINAVNGTRHFAKPKDLYTDWYTYTTRNRQYGLNGVAAESVDAGSDHVTETTGWRLSADTVTNRQKATVTPVIFTPATFTVWQADVLPIEVTVDRPYSVIASFDDVVSGSFLNISSTGAALVSVYTPFATAGKIDLSVASGTATVTTLGIEGRLARRLEQQTAQADDTTSQAAPRGIREGGEIGNEYLGVLASAKGIADHVVWRYGNPQLRPTLTIMNWLPEQFDLDLFEVIAFTSSELDMTAQLFEIVGLTHESDYASAEGHLHTVTYVLQESRVQSAPHWFTLDTSELAAAGTDVLGY